MNLASTIFMMFHLLATVMAFQLPQHHRIFVPRPATRIVVGHDGIKVPTLLYLHYDDFSELLSSDENNVGQVANINNGRQIENEFVDSTKSSQSSFPKLQHILTSPPISYPASISSKILEQFTSSGFINDNDILQFAKGFVVSKEEMLSQILLQDFGWKALDAHRARVGIVSLARVEFGLGELKLGGDEQSGSSALALGSNQQNVKQIEGESTSKSLSHAESSLESKVSTISSSSSLPSEIVSEITTVQDDQSKINATTTTTTTTTEEKEVIKPVPWKSVLVNDKAKRRRSKDIKTTSISSTKSSDGSSTSSSSSAGSISTKDSYNYGLLQASSSDSNNNSNNKDEQTYSNLYHEMDNFWSYMTIPQTFAISDAPIREETAKVYMTHCRLFLGWVVDARDVLCETDLLKKLLLKNTSLEAEAEITGDGTMTSGVPSSPLLQSTSSFSTDDDVRRNVWKHVQERIPSSTSDNLDDLKERISLYDIFPTSETESAAPILQYILWLRSERGVSSNYEANILRGLIKLVKFRFANEISSSSSSLTSQPNSIKNGASPNVMMASSSTRSTVLDDLPIIIELRKLHREAGSKGKKAPRSSDEAKKWLEWSEYLEVIQLLKVDLLEMMTDYQQRLEIESKLSSSDDVNRKTAKQSQAITKLLKAQKKEIATTFQQFLVLSFFACVPDRQRTYRELQLGRSFIKVESEGDGSPVWVIKHTADDYKTGHTYGERPPLPLSASLTPEIDDFIARWRSALENKERPSTFLFLQPRTGNPLTANSIYQIVSRCCYKYKQKKTNPHLLRDMIVTHVRKNGDASEKELEALALFMGHSIQMQRDSYDRRTLEQKVSPAVKLMQNMNSFGESKNKLDDSI